MMIEDVVDCTVKFRTCETLNLTEVPVKLGKNPFERIKKAAAQSAVNSAKSMTISVPKEDQT